MRIEFNIFFESNIASFIITVNHIFWEPTSCRASRSDKSDGLMRQSAFAATETMSGQAFVEKRGDGKDRHWGKNEEKKRVIIGETNVPSRGHIVGLTRLLEKEKSHVCSIEGIQESSTSRDPDSVNEK